MAKGAPQTNTRGAVLSAKTIAVVHCGFLLPGAKLVIELDGGQHFATGHQAKDQARDAALADIGLKVLRFDNRQVLLETDAVLAVTDEMVKGRKWETLNPP